MLLDRSSHLPISFKLIVECEFFALGNSLDGEDSNPELGANNPLFQMTVGIARMVDEAGQASLLGRINDFI